MSSINERIEIFKGDIGDLRKEVKDIKETLMQQNEFILKLLLTRTNTSLSKDVTEPSLQLSTQIETLQPIEETENSLPYVIDDCNISQFTRIFPLKSIEYLNEFEMKINGDNKTYFVNIIKNLLSPDGIYRKIANVLSYNIIMKSNVNGRHYKTNLLSFPKTMDVLFLASRTEVCNSYENYDEFLDELKRALRLAQNRRHTRNFSIKRKLSREQKPQEMPYQIVKTNSYVRTQEIYFPPCS